MVGASRIIVLGAGRGCFPCPHILPKALSSFVVALAFAGLWHMGILRGLRSALLVRGGGDRLASLPQLYLATNTEKPVPARPAPDCTKGESEGMSKAT